MRNGPSAGRSFSRQEGCRREAIRAVPPSCPPSPQASDSLEVARLRRMELEAAAREAPGRFRDSSPAIVPPVPSTRPTDRTVDALSSPQAPPPVPYHQPPTGAPQVMRGAYSRVSRKTRPVTIPATVPYPGPPEVSETVLSATTPGPAQRGPLRAFTTRDRNLRLTRPSNYRF